jgi:Threonyl-tRNA synthetase
MLVVGDKEAETGTVAVREKGKQGSQTLSIDEFVSKIKEIISNKHVL